MDDPIAVRPGGPADHAGAMAAWEAGTAGRGGQSPPAERRDRMRRALAEPGAFLLVAVTSPGPTAGAAGARAAGADGGAAAGADGVGGGQAAGVGGGQAAGGGAAGQVVGIALATQALADDGAGPPIPGHCHVSAVYVRPEWWGRRVGGRLVDAALAAAAARGYRSAQLWTQVDNERAIRLYTGRGFARSGRTKTVDGERIMHLALDRLGPGRDPGPDGGIGPGVAGRAGA